MGVQILLMSVSWQKVYIKCLPILLGDISVIYVSRDVSVWWADALAANILKVLQLSRQMCQSGSKLSQWLTYCYSSAIHFSKAPFVPQLTNKKTQYMFIKFQLFQPEMHKVSVLTLWICQAARMYCLDIMLHNEILHSVWQNPVIFNRFLYSYTKKTNEKEALKIVAHVTYKNRLKINQIK